MPHTMSSMERTAGKQTCSDRIQNTSYAKDEKESAGNAHSPFRFIAAFLYGVLSPISQQAHVYHLPAISAGRGGPFFHLRGSRNSRM